MRRHKFFIALLIVLAVYLGLKTLPEDGWNGWAFGSAQTMLTMRHWVNDGMVYSKFLFTPSGYSKVSRYLDESEMKQHARGTITGKLVGNWNRYTHYPSGYLIPYGILAKLGFEERHWFNLLALAFSLSALVLFYAFLCLISNKTLAFIGVLYYAISTMFLSMADCLANQPIDDFFRFLILLISVLAVNSVSNAKKYKIYSALVWVLYFVLAISSYDSTFFIFIWLVGLDIITFRKFLWKKWLFWLSAPVTAFLLQMAQNMWYLGFHDMVLDAYGSFKFRAGTGPGSNILEKHIRAMFSPLTRMTDFRARFAIPVVSAMFLLFWKFRNKVSAYKWPKIEILFLLALAGCAFSFILSSPGYFPYQGRQMAPFAGLLIASSTVLIFCFFKNFRKYKTELSKFSLVLFAVFIVLAGALWFSQAERTYFYIQDQASYRVPKSLIKFSRALKEISGGKDSVVFRLDDDSTEFSRYPQISPVVEYYIGMPVLSFKNISDLVYDFKWLKNRSEFPFRAIILVNDQKEKEEIERLLGGDGQIFILIYPGLGFALSGLNI